MSSQRGNIERTRPQRHQNTRAFHHNKNSKKSAKIDSAPMFGLCQRCIETLAWKKKFHKYKPLTAPRRCNGCQERTITRAYMTLCDNCARERKVCAKCGKQGQNLSEQNLGDNMSAAQLKHTLEPKLAQLSERERRAFLRKIERGELTVTEEERDGEEPSSADHDRPLPAISMLRRDDDNDDEISSSDSD